MPGDRIAILGASGSGKSTLLRCLNFMERPSAGVVELAGQAIGRAAPGKADAGRRTLRRSRADARAPARRHGVPAVQPVPAHDRARQRDGGAAHGARPARGRGAHARSGRARPRRPRRQGRGLPGAALGRAEAARRHRPRAGDGPRGAAVRRADLGARPRAGGRGAARDPLARRGRPHDAAGDARDRLRVPRRQPRALHRRGRDPRAGHARPGAQAPDASRARGRSSSATANSTSDILRPQTARAP